MEHTYISSWNLPEEDVHGQQNAHACQILTHLVRVILDGQLAQHVLSELIDDALTRLATAAAALLGLHAEYGIQDACKWRVASLKWSLICKWVNWLLAWFDV